MKPVPSFPGMGLCPHCGLIKPFEDFYRQTAADRRTTPPVMRDRYSPYCRTCTAAVSIARQHTPEGRQARRAAQARWKAAHPDQVRAANREAQERQRRRRGVPERGPVGFWTCRTCRERKPHAAFPEGSATCTDCRTARAERATANRARRAERSRQAWQAFGKRWREENPEFARLTQQRAGRAYYQRTQAARQAQREEAG